MSKRVHVKLKDFLRVAIVERSTYDTHEKAANELGMTVSSFKQRLSKEKKEYPSVFEGVPRYAGQGAGPKRASESEALEILAELKQNIE